MATVEHNFSGALATWKSEERLTGCSAFSLIHPLKGVNLSELQKTLDTQGIELVENQKESVVGRKALADKTKGSYPGKCFSSLLTIVARIQEDPGR